MKSTDLQKQVQELKKCAPEGLEPLRRKVLELETKLKDVPPTDAENEDAMPSDRDGLEKLGEDLNAEINVTTGQIASLDEDLQDVESKLAQGRIDVTGAKERSAGLDATANSRLEELGRLRTEEQIADRVDQAKIAWRRPRMNLIDPN